MKPAKMPYKRSEKSATKDSLNNNSQVCRPCRQVCRHFTQKSREKEISGLNLSPALVGLAAGEWTAEALLEYVCWVVYNNREFLLNKVTPSIKHPVYEAEFRETMISAPTLHERFQYAWDKFFFELGNQGTDEALAETKRLEVCYEAQAMDLPGIAIERTQGVPGWLESICVSLYNAASLILEGMSDSESLHPRKERAVENNVTGHLKTSQSGSIQNRPH